jgi:hypothetical protein
MEEGVCLIFTVESECHGDKAFDLHPELSFSIDDDVCLVYTVIVYRESVMNRLPSPL